MAPNVIWFMILYRLKSDVLKRGPPSTHTARASPVWACGVARVCVCVRSSLLFEWGGRLLSLSIAWTLRVSALPLSVCLPLCFSLPLSLCSVWGCGGLLSCFLCILLSSLAFLRVHSALLSTCLLRSLAFLRSCFLVFLLSSYSLLSVCSLFVLFRFSLSFSLCTLWTITFRCSESFAVVRSYSHPSGTRSLNLSRLLVPYILVRFSLSLISDNLNGIGL